MRARAKLGADAALLVMDERADHGTEPAAPVAAAMAACDVFIAPTVKSLSHTEARAARLRGRRARRDDAGRDRGHARARDGDRLRADGGAVACDRAAAEPGQLRARQRPGRHRSGVEPGRTGRRRRRRRPDRARRVRQPAGGGGVHLARRRCRDRRAGESCRDRARPPTADAHDRRRPPDGGERPRGRRSC